MNYPLDLSFKILAFAPQLSVRDAAGNMVFYVKQKLFKLKEAVTVFADAEQTRPLYTIKADRVFDWSARYNFADVNGMPLGAVKRRGAKSLWKAHYDVLDGETEVMNIQEESALVKFIDGLVGELPVIGMFTGYMFHPAYLVARNDGTVIMRLQKQPAFLEGKFRLESKMPVSEDEERRALLSLMIVVLLERDRG